MKSFLTLLSVAIGLAFWFQDHPLVRDKVAWARTELGITKGDTNRGHPQYITAAVETGELRRVITATGTLNATVNVEVGSQLSGQISQIFVDFNDQVKKGQPLARLDHKSFQARVDEAQAAREIAQVGVSVARVKVERAAVGALDLEAQRAVLRARTDNARVAVSAAGTALRRKEALQAQGVGAFAELEDARSKEASTSAALREAEAIESAHEHKVTAARVDLRQAQSELDTAIAWIPQKQAVLRVAHIELDRTTISSPIDGVIVGRNVNEGQTLATTMEAKTLFIVAGDLHEMEIHAKVDEADIGKIQAGQEALFSVDAHPGRQFTALVRQLRKAPQTQQNVVTYTVVLTAANREDLLLPGMTALVRVTVNRTGPSLKMPLAGLRFSPIKQQSVQSSQDKIAAGRFGFTTPSPVDARWFRDLESGKSAAVWIMGENGEPKSLVVGVGEDDGSHVAVVSGPLRQGDRVILAEAPESAPKRLFGIRIGL